MNVENNPKTFDYFFCLFLKHSEAKLGRKLTEAELNTVRKSISAKCESIPKKDIVREIYNFQLADLEKSNGHLNVLQRYKLKQKVCNKTNSPMRFKSTSKSLELAISASRNIERIHSTDIAKKTLRRPSLEERKTLRNSYIKDHFHYRAPLTLSQKLKRAAAIGFVSLTLLSASVGAKQFVDTVRTHSDDVSISDVSNTEETTKQTLESTIEADLLQDFKNRYADEYKKLHEGSLISSGDLNIKDVQHTYLFKVHTTDSNGSPIDILVTKGARPQETENSLKARGYSFEYTDPTWVISTGNADRTIFYEASTEFGDPVFPGEDLENLQAYVDALGSKPNVLAQMSRLLSLSNT